MEFGPTGYAFELDGITPGASATDAPTLSGAMQELPRITKCNGILEEAMAVPITAFGDTVESEGPLGLSKFEDIVIGGFIQVAADGTIDDDSAHTRVGPAARNDQYPARTFKMTHRTGVTQQIEVWVKKNQRMPTLDNKIEWEATLGIAARDVASDYGETGF